MRITTLCLASALLVAVPLSAEPQKAEPQKAEAQKAEAQKAEAQKDGKSDDAFGDLFGDSLSGSKKNRMDDLEEAAGNVKAGGHSDALLPKAKSNTGTGGVDFLDQFVAERIQVTKKEGCIPAEPDRIRLTYLEYYEVPAKSPKLSLCLKMSSRVNRQVRITATIVNPRLKRVARAESVVSFAGTQRADHVLDYPEMNLDMTGKYLLMVDIDGKPVAKLPLFDVRLATGN